MKESTPYVARFNELNSKYGQTLIDNKNLKDANKASITYLMIILNVIDYEIKNMSAVIRLL